MTKNKQPCNEKHPQIHRFDDLMNVKQHASNVRKVLAFNL